MVREVAMVGLPDTASHEEAVPVALHPLVQGLRGIFTSSIVFYPFFYVLKQPWITRHCVSLAFAGREAVTKLSAR